jgi:hypothetical protein
MCGGTVDADQQRGYHPLPPIGMAADWCQLHSRARGEVAVPIHCAEAAPPVPHSAVIINYQEHTLAAGEPSLLWNASPIWREQASLHLHARTHEREAGGTGSHGRLL